MTKPETVHAYALIGLRALADSDAVEFHRATDRSKAELDNQIAGLMEKVREEPEFNDLRSRLAQLRRTSDAALIAGIGDSCMLQAQMLAATRQVGRSGGDE